MPHYAGGVYNEGSGSPSVIVPSTADNSRYGGNGVDGSNFIGRWWNNITGAAANNEFNSKEASAAREFNSVEAEKDRDFQLYMSNTAYQRAAADMKAAGINPAALGGASVSPASTPQGSRANSSPAASNSAAYGNGILDIAKTALTIALFKKFTGTAIKAASAPAAVKDVGKSAAAATSASKVANSKVLAAAGTAGKGALKFNTNFVSGYPAITF